MKTCKTILQRLNSSENEPLSADEQRLLKEHLQGCPSCAEHQAYLQSTKKVMQRWEVPEASNQLSKNLQIAIRETPQDLTWSEYWDRSRWFPVAATVAFAMSVLLIVGTLSIPVQQQSNEQLIKQKLRLIQGPSFKTDKVSFAAQALGVELK